VNSILKSTRGKELFFILLLALTLRLLALFFVIDTKSINNYEYGEICKNILQGKGYSLFYYENDKLEYKNTAYSIPFPSAYMPPGYPAFLLPFFYIENANIRNITILFVQNLFSLLIILFLYLFTEKYFSKKTAMFAGLLYSLLPEFIIASNSVNIVTLYHLFIILLFIVLFELKKTGKIYPFIFLGAISSILIYIRTEFILFFLVILVILFTNFKRIYILSTLALVIIALLPWQIHNYKVFEKPVFGSTSGGINLYRGHNPYEIGAWGDDTISNELKAFQSEKGFEIKMDSIYYSHAIKSITTESGKEFIIPFIKLFHLWLLNPGDERTKSSIYYIPWFIILLFSITGLLKTFRWERYKYIYIFLIYSTVVSLIFFALPRYQTMMKIALVPFAAAGMEILSNYIFKRKP
jgi:4-amino-4-deoxy-L-arabinose transferase-like glycosyltransferase